LTKKALLGENKSTGAPSYFSKVAELNQNGELDGEDESNESEKYVTIHK